MKIIKQLKKLSLLIFLLTFVSATAFAQTYVDATNGNDVTGSGTAVAPYASIAKGLSAMSKSGGTLVLKAGTYTGAGLASTNDDIIIRKSQVIDGHTQPAWDDNVVITIRLEQLNGNNVILISDSDPAQAFTFDVKGGTLNIVSASGTEYINLTGTVTMNLGTVATRSVSVNIGTLNSGGGNITATAGAILNINDASAFTGEAPKTTNPAISYLGTGSQTAGAEAKYGAFGTGTISVNKTNNSDVVTFPATAITGIGAINIAKGGATFQAAVTVDGDVTVGNGGAVNFTDLNMKNNDFNHGGTGAVTISGKLDFSITDGAGAANLGQLNVTGGGNFTVNGATQWTESITADRDFLALSAINLANGNVTLNGVTLTNNNGDGTNNGDDYTFRFYNNDNNGTLTVGTVTTNSTAAANKGYGILNVINQNTGTVSVNGAIRNNVTNVSTGTVSVYGTIGGNLTNTVANGKVNITGATSVAGVLTNAGNSNGANTGYMALTSNTLTLSGNSAHLTNGGTITATSGGIVITATGANSFNGGTLSNVTLNGTGGTTTFGTNAIGVTALTVTKGTAAIGIATTASGTTTVNGGALTIGNFAYTTNDFAQTSGTVTLAANAASKLDVNGNFNRTAGTFTAGLTSTVLLSGTSAQNMNGGPSFQLASMTVSNTGGTVTIANTIRASGTITVNTGAKVELGNFNLVFNAATGIMVNNGTIQTTGNTNGAVIFGGANFVAGGLNVDGMKINASSSAVFSNIIIDVGSANDVITTGSAGSIRWTKELYLYTGDLNNNSAVDLAPSGTGASVKRDLSTAAGSVNGVVLGGGGTFNAAAVDYNLTYTGTLTGNKTINTTTAVEWDNNNVVDLTQSAAGGSFAVILAGNVNRSIKGNLTITGDATAANAARITGDNGDLTAAGNINVGQNSILALANNGGTDLTLSGALTVGNSAAITGGNAGSVISLAGNNQTHSILGAITAASILTVNGTGVTINGQPASATANQSEIANLTVAAAKSATVSQIHAINGAVTTGATSTLSLGLTQPSAASPVDNTDGNGTVTGLITLGGTSFTLTSAVEAQSGITHNKGTLDFGANNLTLTTAGTFTRAADASAVYTSTSGALVSNFAATYDFNGGTIPFWDVKKAITLANAGSDITVTKELDIQTGGSIANGGADITIQTLLTTVGGAVVTGTGSVIFTGTQWIASGAAPSISNVEINSTAGTTTFETSDLATPTYRTFTITGVFTQTAGDVAIGGNSVQLIGSTGDVFTRVTGNWTATTGIFEFKPTANAAVAFNPGTGWSIPNLQINSVGGTNTVTTNENKSFTVTGILTLVDGVLHTQNTLNASTDGLLHLGTGAIVKRDAAKASLNEVPTFDGTVDVWYITAAGNTGKELPTAATVLNDMQVKVSTVVSADATVNGTLFLMGGALSEAVGKNLTIANGATINRSNGAIATAPQVTSYDLIYSNTGDVTTGPELIGSKIANMSILPTGGKNVVLGAAVTMSGNLVLNGATTATQLDLAGFNLSTAGNVTVTSGTLTNSGAATTKLTFNGAAAQTFTVPAAGLQYPATNTNKGMEIVLNNTSTAGVTLTGGNLTMANLPSPGVPPVTANTSIVRFINGVLKTGTNVVTLWQANNSATNQPIQGFDRSGVLSGKYSHIVGNVKKYVNNSTGTSIDRSQVIFPVGTLPASPGNYRPLSIFFKTAPQSAVNLTVSEVDASPQGTNGIPLNTGTFSITNYPNFYWYVKSDQALTPSYKYDMELQAQGYTDYIKDGIQNIRMIRRDSGNVSNEWRMQGSNTSYDNSTINSSWPVLKVIDAQGGITQQGSRFTYSQNNKPPVFTAALAPVTIAEGDSVLFTYTATDPDINQTATLSAVTLPANATFDSTTGAFKWVTNFADAGTHTVTIRATDGTLNTDTTVTITVTNVNQLPKFVNTPSDTTMISEGSVYTFTVTASDPDADNTGFTYSLAAAADSVKIDGSTGALTINPAFGDQGHVVNYTIRVTDGSGGSVDSILTYKVTKTDRAPVFNTAMNDTTVDENALLTLDFGPNASDPDAGDVITFTRKLYSGSTLVSTLNGAITSAGVFTWTPTYTQAGVYSLIVTASDGTLSVDDTVAVTVNNKNAAPTWVTVLQNTTILVGDTLNFQYVANDLDNDPLTFTLDVPNPQTLSIIAQDDTSATIQWIPVAADTASYNIGMKATDGTATISTSAVVIVKTTTVTLAGKVTYENTNNDAIGNAAVKLMQGTTLVDTTTTDAAGNYSFSGVMAGDYSVMVSKTDGWPVSSILASDALLAARSSVDTTVILTSMQKLAGDVSGDGAVNSFDALQILQRVVKSITGFAIADWQFAATSVTVGTSNKTANIKGIAAGDVNESYDASAPKAGIVSTVESSTLKISPNAEFTLPITLDASEAISAFTLRFSYPAAKMEFKEVKSNSVKAITHIANGKISIAWADLNGKKSFTPNGDPVILLVFKATKAFSKSETEGLTLNQAEIVNKSGKSISSSSIKLTSAEIALPEKFELGQNYPNPFNPSTIIEYALPVKGNVKLTIFNTLGQKVVSLVSKVQDAGNYKIAFDASRLSSGVYLYNLTVEGAKNFVQTKKMILLK